MHAHRGSTRSRGHEANTAFPGHAFAGHGTGKLQPFELFSLDVCSGTFKPNDHGLKMFVSERRHGGDFLAVPRLLQSPLFAFRVLSVHLLTQRIRQRMRVHRNRYVRRTASWRAEAPAIAGTWSHARPDAADLGVVALARLRVESVLPAQVRTPGSPRALVWVLLR